MDALLQKTLTHLKALVAIDTQNQSGNADASRLFDYVEQQLDGFTTQRHGTAGAGDLTLHARRGDPDVLVNIHADTVPAGSQWQQDPFKLTVTDNRAIGLGACDIKGAIACWLAAIETCPGAEAALLLCSDEEAGGSRGIRNYLAAQPEYKLALIAEPTQCQGVAAHRGYLSATVQFSGQPGHSSEPRALQENAIHQCSRYLVKLQQLAGEHLQTIHPDYPQLRGICLNAGKISGGTKNNIIADQAELSFGSRPLPGQSSEALLSSYQQIDNAGGSYSHWQTLSNDPPLPAGPDAPSAARYLQQLDIPAGEPVSFWTEAALFSAAGIPAIVFGPGDIAQAHTADEWIELDQLQQMAQHYSRLLRQQAVIS